MIATEYCDSCNEGILWKCSSCEKENDRSIHTYHPGFRDVDLTKAAPASVVGILMSVVSGFTAVAQI